TGLALGDISARVPIIFNGSSDDGGALKIGSVAFHGTPLRPIAGSLQINNGRVEGTMEWQPATGAKVNATGWITSGAGGAKGHVTISAPKFQIESADAWRRVYPNGGDVEVTGTFG